MASPRPGVPLCETAHLVGAMEPIKEPRKSLPLATDSAPSILAESRSFPITDRSARLVEGFARSPRGCTALRKPTRRGERRRNDRHQASGRVSDRPPGAARREKIPRGNRAPVEPFAGSPIPLDANIRMSSPAHAPPPGDDPAIIAAARTGQGAAWRALLERYQIPLHTYARELLHHDTAALDLVQDTFIAAHRHLPGLRDDSRFGAWLFGIAHQKIILHWRRADREEPLDADALDATPDELAPGPRDGLLRSEQAAALLDLVDELPPPQRAVLLLHFIEDFPLETIAEITAAPLGTVKSRLFHARRALRERLDAPDSAHPAAPAAAIVRPRPA